MSKYDWKLKSFAKGLDADIAVNEFERIENVYGALTPENILKDAISETSVFHALFEWDDSRAAISYRLQQARTILNNITVKVVSDGQSRNIPVYEVINLGEARCYRNVEQMSPADVEQVRKATINDLNRVNDKLSFYKNFDTAISHISNAISSI